MAKLCQKIRRCRYCCYENDSELYVLTHEVLIHKEKVQNCASRISCKKYGNRGACKLCGTVTTNFAKHFSGHIFNYKFPCFLCTMSCKSWTSLRKHSVHGHGSDNNQRTKYRKAMVDVMLIQSEMQQEKEDECLDVTSNVYNGNSSLIDSNSTQTLKDTPATDKQPPNNTASEIMGLPDCNGLPVNSSCQLYDVYKVGEVYNSNVTEMAGCGFCSLDGLPPVMYCPLCPFACNDKEVVLKHLGQHLTSIRMLWFSNFY